MNEDSQIDPDKGIAITGSQGGSTGNGQNVGNEIPVWSTEEGMTVENVVDHQQTGVDLDTTEEDTVQSPPDNRKSWLIVITVSVIFGCSSLQSVLQRPTFLFFGQTELNESTFCGQTKTNDSTFCGQIKTNESLFLGQTKTSETTFFEATKINRSLTKSYVPTTSAYVADTVVTTQTILFSVFGPVSATLILVIGYRWVAQIGGVLLGVGCLGAAFCSTSSIHLVAFLYGALPGMGQAMIFVSTTVAILEHFKKRRLTALFIPLLGGFLFVAVLIIMFAFIFIYMSNNSVIAGTIYTWKGSLLLQAGGAGVVIPFSLFLKPLKLRMMDGNKSSFVLRVFRIDGLQIYRHPTLYTFTLVWFLWEGGCAILKSKLSSFGGKWIIPSLSLEMILANVFQLGLGIGAFVPCCIPQTVSLRTIIIVVSTFCVTAGFLNLFANFLHVYIYAIIFYGILGIFKGVATPIFEFAIPLVLGEEHITMGTGFFVMGEGLGGVTMTLAADEIEKMTKKVDGCFYLAGVLFLCGFAFTVGTYLLIRRANRIETNKPRQNPAQ